MKRLFTILISLLSLLPVHAHEKEAWCGDLIIGPQKLPLVFNLQRGDTPTVTIDSPSQNAFGIPATLLHLTEDSIAVSVPMIGAEFRGRVQQQSMRGVFSQNGYNFPLELTLSTNTTPQTNNRSQTPETPLPYITREVTFTNSADGYLFHATLTLPVGYTSGQKVTGVVLVSGSGVQNRDEELMGHKPFAVISDYLARHGIASLRYDDRGWDKSRQTGALTVQSNTADAAAAVKWLRQCREIGPVGIIGHSEGGVIGYALGASTDTDRPDFVISLAGPLIKGDSLLVAHNRAILTAMGVPEITVNQYCMLLPTALSLMGSRNLQPLEGRIENLSPRMEASLIENLYSIAKTDDPWLKSFVDYDPVPALKTITVPTLIFLGRKDVQVPWKENEQAFSAINNPCLHLSIVEEHNHLFQRCTTGLPAEYAGIKETISPDILRAILAFIPQ